MNNTGCWTEQDEFDTHVFDESLCVAIGDMFHSTMTNHVSLVDIGCGDGSYSKFLFRYGIDCKCFDGSPKTLELSGGYCDTLDFSVKQDIGKFDVVLCLEVGEHIPKEYEEAFLNNVISAAKKTIILSWAIPGQGGTGHVNCKTNKEVIIWMKEHDFRYDVLKSEFLRKKATLSWFKNTLMLFEWNQ